MTGVSSAFTVGNNTSTNMRKPYSNVRAVTFVVSMILIGLMTTTTTTNAFSVVHPQARKATTKMMMMMTTTVSRNRIGAFSPTHTVVNRHNHHQQRQCEGKVMPVYPTRLGMTDAPEEPAVDSDDDTETKLSLITRFRKWFAGEGADGLTAKERLAKAGLAALLSYGFVSNMSYAVSVSLAWFIFNKRVRRRKQIQTDSKTCLGSVPTLLHCVCCFGAYDEVLT